MVSDQLVVTLFSTSIGLITLGIAEARFFPMQNWLIKIVSGAFFTVSWAILQIHGVADVAAWITAPFALLHIGIALWCFTTSLSTRAEEKDLIEEVKVV